MSTQERTQVFISYSHEDAEWLRRLQIMLKPLTRNQSIALWDDTRIQAGAKWREEIQQALAAARVAVRASLYRETEIADYQAANNPAKPLSSLEPWQVDSELVKIAEQIKEAVSQPITLPQQSAWGSPPQPMLAKLLITKQPFAPEMILIPVGKLLMGSGPQQDDYALDHEQPQHHLYLPDYYLAKTPVTHAQYRAFVLATGREPPLSWTNRTPRHGEEDHPVMCVSWYDARDYCQWLSEMTGRAYSLPSEAEWEKGTRGTDGRIYPWANQWDATCCNSGENGMDMTTSVHAYPQGASPYGVLDMVGNVHEWTRSLWGRNREHSDYRYPYTPTDGREDLDARHDVLRVVRGGSFGEDHRSVRCAHRVSGLSYLSDRHVGFRVGDAPLMLPALPPAARGSWIVSTCAGVFSRPSREPWFSQP